MWTVVGAPEAPTVLCSALTFSLCRHHYAQRFYGEFESSTLPQPAQAGPPSEASFHSAPLAMASTEVAQRVAAAVRSVLGPDVGPEQPLVAAGLDSLGVQSMSTTIKKPMVCYMAVLSGQPESCPGGFLCQVRWSCAMSCLAYSILTCLEHLFTIIPRPRPLPLYSLLGSLLRLSNL